MIRRLAAALGSLLVARTVLAADDPDRRTVLTARDEVFSRPEYALREESEPSALVTFLEWFGELVLTFRDEHPTAFKVTVVVLLLVLLTLIAHILWTVAAARRAKFETPFETPDLDLRLADPVAFRNSAARMAEAGDLDGAVRELYTALLVALERRGDVSWARHKALLDYRLEARSDAARDALDLFAGSYHPASFGRRPLTAERFANLLRTVDGVMR